MGMKTEKKDCRRFVLFEPSLLRIIERQSENMYTGSGRHKSISDYFRKAVKEKMLRECPNLENIEEIDWKE